MLLKQIPLKKLSYVHINHLIDNEMQSLLSLKIQSF